LEIRTCGHKEEGQGWGEKVRLSNLCWPCVIKGGIQRNHETASLKTDPPGSVLETGRKTRKKFQREDGDAEREKMGPGARWRAYTLSLKLRIRENILIQCRRKVGRGAGR